MKKILSLIVLSFFFACHIVKADIAFQFAEESSNVEINKPLKIELQNAIVNIDMDQSIYGYKSGYLEANFEIFSNEKNKIPVKAYLKAKGIECYKGCEDIDAALSQTEFKVNNQEIYTSLKPYATSEGTFASSEEFILQPKKLTTISVSQDIISPFQYYLNSLYAFQKINHEKITIQGKNLNVKFNQAYPAKKISDTEWIWEYSNINPQDKNLNNILTIERNPEAIKKVEPPKNLFQKIIDYFKGVWKRTKNILIY